MKRNWPAITLIAFATAIVAALLTALPTWLLWNWLCPKLFGLPTVTFLEALGLALLCSMLFKGSQSSSG